MARIPRMKMHQAGDKIATYTQAQNDEFRILEKAKDGKPITENDKLVYQNAVAKQQEQTGFVSKNEAHFNTLAKRSHDKIRELMNNISQISQSQTAGIFSLVGATTLGGAALAMQLSHDSRYRGSDYTFKPDLDRSLVTSNRAQYIDAKLKTG